MCDRLASMAAIALIAAGSANAANAGTEAGDSAAAAVPAPDQSAADAAATPSSVKPTARPPARVRTSGTLQHRIDVLSKALQLDERQRTELLGILERQRETVTKIWSDPKMLPAERTPATHALQERTADQIRAILSDEQKKLYNPPKPQGAETPQPDVAGWMQKQAQARQQK